MSHPASPVFSRKLRNGGRVRRFVVEMAPTYRWQIRDECDAELIRHITYDDWHRVEMAVRRFEFEAAQLVREGWQDA